MKTFASVLVLLVGVVQAQDPPATDSKLALARLQQARADKEPAILVDAILRYGRIADDEIARQLGKALQHKDPEVQRAALQALRHNPQPAALTALLGANTDKLLADEDTAVEFFYALGQKADAKALPLLCKGLRIDRGSPVVRARILAMGRIRTSQAVDELMQLLKSGGGGKKNGRGGNPHMADLRVALAALTGEDHGNDESAWITWWAEHDERYELPKSVVLQKPLARQWDSLWGDAPKGKRKKGGT